MAKKTAGIGLNVPSQPAAMVAEQRRWRAESDVRTLKEAEQIRSDRSRFNDAKRMAKSEVKALTRVAGKR